jgi:hypothetical protein
MSCRSTSDSARSRVCPVLAYLTIAEESAIPSPARSCQYGSPTPARLCCQRRSRAATASYLSQGTLLVTTSLAAPSCRASLINRALSSSAAQRSSKAELSSFHAALVAGSSVAASVLDLAFPPCANAPTPPSAAIASTATSARRCQTFRTTTPRLSTRVARALSELVRGTPTETGSCQVTLALALVQRTPFVCR